MKNLQRVIDLLIMMFGLALACWLFINVIFELAKIM